MSDVFLRLSPSTGATGSSLQFMVLESAPDLVPSSDATKYSLDSAAVSALSSGGNMQKVVISTQGQHLQGTGLPHKVILTTPTGTLLRFGSVASSRSDTVSSANSGTDIISSLALVNKLLSGVISSDGNLRPPSIPGSPKQKKMKLDRTLIPKDISKRKKIVDHFSKKLRLLKYKYYHQQAEYFFLKSGGNIMDHIIWKKKLPIELLEHLRANKFDPHDDVNVITECLLTEKRYILNTACGFPGELGQRSNINYASSSHPQSPSRAISSHMKCIPSCSPSLVTPQMESQEEVVERNDQIMQVYEAVEGVVKVYVPEGYRSSILCYFCEKPLQVATYAEHMTEVHAKKSEIVNATVITLE